MLTTTPKNDENLDQTANSADELGAYLDADLGDISEPGAVDDEPETHIEDLHDEAEKPVPFLKGPAAKLGGTVGGGALLLIAVLGFITHSCDGGVEKKVAAQKPQDSKDKLIAQLRENNQLLASQIEKDTQARQAAKYMQTAPKAGAKAGAKAKPNAATVASSASGSGGSSSSGYSRPSYTPASYSPPPTRVVSFPAPARPAPAPVVPRVDSAQSAEIASLKQQLKNLLSERTKKAEQVALAPEPVEPVVEEQSVDEPSMLQNAVATESPQAELIAAAPVDGGIEELALMSGRPMVSIAPGTEAQATLLVPIVGERSQVVLSLDSDIMDSQGRLTIPSGAKLLGYGQIVNGVASITLQSAVIDGAVTALPQTAAIAVLGEGKKAIIAKRISGGGGNGPSMGRTLLGALLDAGSSGIGQLLAPQTTSTFSSGADITSQSVNQPNSLGNAGLAAAGGLTSGISNGLKAGLTAQPQAQSTTPAMGVKAGIKLSLVFISPLEMLSAQAIGPEVEQDLIPSADQM